MNKPLGTGNKALPNPWLALIPFVTLIVLLIIVIRVFGTDAMDGGSQIALFSSAAVAVAVALLFCKVQWKSIEEGIASQVKSITSAVLIMFMIGAIAGSWMISGVVPTLIYYGLKILTPKIFLFAVCLICALVSMMTGSSWTTVATIGVAFIGIGTVLGFSPGWTAGAILSGAYFGDEISPLSDTTVLSSSMNDVPLFKHIRYLLITAVPSLVIALTIFLIVSLNHEATSEIRVQEFSDALRGTFNISPWLMIVPAITALMIAKKMPALQTLFLAALVAGITALIAQPELVSYIGGGHSARGMFRGLCITFYGDTSVPTSNEALGTLVQTRGMRGMLSTVFLILAASTFGGAVTGSGMVQSLTNVMVKAITGRKSLVTTTVATGLFSNVATADQYLSILLVSNFFKNLYKEKGYEGRLLSRATEDSVTVTSVLVPWNTCGMTQSTVLRVPTLEYLPYCFFNILAPFMSIIIACLGYKIFKVKPEAAVEAEVAEN